MDGAGIVVDEGVVGRASGRLDGQSWRIIGSIHTGVARCAVCGAAGDERDRAKFAKAQSYMLLLDDKAACKNMRCRKRFDISGIKTIAFLQE